MIEYSILIKALWFIIPGLLGMLYAYTWKFVDEIKDKTYFTYLFGDTRALLKALLVFIASSAGMLSLDYLNLLDELHLMIAGVGLGLLIPQKVDEKSAIKK